MQTFLPYPNFFKTAKVLDMKRLGKQRCEVLQILQTLLNKDKNKKIGWKNHPAVKMWENYEIVLCIYGIAICKEWISRGHKDTCLDKINKILSELVKKNPHSKNPPWRRNKKFHSAHRAALLFKNFEHYKQFKWTETPKIDYIWPSAK